jgi:hypothetical protein
MMQRRDNAAGQTRRITPNYTAMLIADPSSLSRIKNERLHARLRTRFRVSKEKKKERDERKKGRFERGGGGEETAAGSARSRGVT